MSKNIGNILQEGTALLSTHWKSLVFTCAPLCSLFILSSLVDAYFALNPQNLAIDIYHPILFYARLILLAITFVLMCATQLGNIHLSLDAVKSRANSAKSYLFSYPIQQFLQYLLLWLILIVLFIPAGVIAGIGLLLLIIPGLIIITAYKLWAILFVYNWVDDRQENLTNPISYYFKRQPLNLKPTGLKPFS